MYIYNKSAHTEETEFIKNKFIVRERGEGGRKREGERERKTDRQTETERERGGGGRQTERESRTDLYNI